MLDVDTMFEKRITKGVEIVITIHEEQDQNRTLSPPYMSPIQPPSSWLIPEPQKYAESMDP